MPRRTLEHYLQECMAFYGEGSLEPPKRQRIKKVADMATSAISGWLRHVCGIFGAPELIVGPVGLNNWTSRKRETWVLETLGIQGTPTTTPRHLAKHGLGRS